MTKTFRSKKLLRSIQGMPCMSCGLWKATVVPAHVNSVVLGKGTGHKPSDALICAACQDCHDFIDGRKGNLSKEDKMMMWFYAFARTVERWFQEGIVQVK